MTEAQKKMLALLEVRVHDLLALCAEQKQTIQNLYSLLEEKDSQLKNALTQVEILHAKCEHLLMVRVISEAAEASEIKDAKSHIAQLVREVDKCITLLNK